MRARNQRVDNISINLPRARVYCVPAEFRSLRSGSDLREMFENAILSQGERFCGGTKLDRGTRRQDGENTEEKQTKKTLIYSNCSKVKG